MRIQVIDVGFEHQERGGGLRIGLSQREPDHVGSVGWAKLTFDANNPPPRELLQRWIDESHRTIVGPQEASPPKPKGKAKKSKTAPR